MADKKMGAVTITVGADPKERMVLIGFNHALNRIELTPEGALELAKQIGIRAAIASGDIPPPPPPPRIIK